MNQDLTVKGFSFSAVESGIRGKKRLDIGLVACDKPAAAAAVYTTSRVKAAPVLLGMEKIKSGKAQAIMINSGIANACTGEEGMQNAITCSSKLAGTLNIDEELGNLIVVQTAYSASARVLTAVDELFQELLNAVR